MWIINFQSSDMLNISSVFQPGHLGGCYEMLEDLFLQYYYTE